MYNKKSLENLKPYTKGEERCRINGSKGGKRSGEVRFEKSQRRKWLIRLMELDKFLRGMDKEEFEDFIKEFDESQKERIRLFINPPEKEIKK